MSTTKKDLEDLFDKFVEDVDEILVEHGRVDFKAIKMARHYMDTGYALMQFAIREE